MTAARIVICFENELDVETYVKKNGNVFLNCSVCMKSVEGFL